MVSSKRKGYGRERELVQLLEKKGWWASRLPASGRLGGFDVVAAKNGKLVFFEVKAREASATVYLERWRWEEVLGEAAKAGAEAYLALRVPLTAGSVKWWIRPLNDPDSVSQSNVVFHPPAKAAGKWFKLEGKLS